MVVSKVCVMISPFVQVVSVLLLAPIYLHRVWFLLEMGMYGVFLWVFSSYSSSSVKKEVKGLVNELVLVNRWQSIDSSCRK